MQDTNPVPIKADRVNHPAHYGGAHDPFEAIKVIEAWNLGFNLGNALKYIKRHSSTKSISISDKLEDLQKAAWYINREISNLQKGA